MIKNENTIIQGFYTKLLMFYINEHVQLFFSP